MIIFFIAVALIVFCIYMIVFTSKKAKEKKAQLDSRGAISHFTATHVEGLVIQPNMQCDILQFDDRIQIESGANKFQIPIENIRVAVVKGERELIEKGKSVVGRALIGTVLVPGLGTIVGGMSGIGSKKKKGDMKYFLILNYVNSKGDMDAVTFLDDTFGVKSLKFCESINDTVTINTNGKAMQL